MGKNSEAGGLFHSTHKIFFGSFWKARPDQVRSVNA